MGGCLAPDGAASESSDLRDLRAGQPWLRGSAAVRWHTPAAALTRAPAWAAGNLLC